MTSMIPIPATVPAEQRPMVEAVFTAVEAVRARFGRELFLQRAREGGHARELWEALADNDLLALGVPEEYGGVGGGLVATTAVMEALARAGTPPLLYSLTSFSREAVVRHGTYEQIARFVTPSTEGKLRLCFGVTEPTAGTNSFAISTHARRVGDGYLLRGQKVFISGADEADYILVLARTGDIREKPTRTSGFGLFVVDLASPGIALRQLDIQWYAPERQFEVFFADVVLPADALIGTEGSGFDYLLSSLNPERVVISAWALGLGQYALDKAVAYAKVRAPFGTPIGAHQAVAHPLALAQAEMTAARQLMYAAAAAFDAGENAGTQANMAKLLASRAALAAVDAAIQTHGGSAFVYETDVVTLWPMIRVLQIAPINNEVVLNYLAEHELGLPRST